MEQVNAVTTKENHSVSTELANEWGAPTLTKNDIILPKILMMQGMSELVGKGEAQIGQMVDSISGAILGDLTKPLEVIPFFVDKCFDILLEQADGKFKWTKTIPIVEDPLNLGYNDNLPWEEEVQGLKQKNVRRYNFYVLIPSEVADGSAIPYVFSFKSTSAKEGKKLMSQMYMRNLRAGLPPPAFKIKLSGTRVKNDKGTFIVPNYSLSERTSAAELSVCKEWISTIRAGNARVDDSDVQNEIVGEVPVGSTGEF